MDSKTKRTCKRTIGIQVNTTDGQEHQFLHTEYPKDELGIQTTVEGWLFIEFTSDKAMLAGFPTKKVLSVASIIEWDITEND